jgi:adenylate cyclase class IV
MDIPPAAVETAVQIFNDLGFADTRHEAFNERHDFRYKDVEIAMKRSEAWGHHAEFEILLNDSPSESEKAEAVARIHQVAEEIGVRLMTENELAKFTEEFEQAQAAKALLTSDTTSEDPAKRRMVWKR